MIIDARTLSDNETIETDVCIVGAGTAGITLAKEFIGQKFSVCLLESGGLKPDKETQALYRGENVGQPYFPLETARARYFGGSSNRWQIVIGENSLGARMRPLDEIDFEERESIPYSGWPFDKSCLDPFYARAQSICGIDPLTYDVLDWRDSKKSPPLPFLGGRVKTVIFKIGSRNPFIDDYPQQVIRSANIATYLYANVVEIETDEWAQIVTRLRVACLHGTKFWVSAKLFVLALGGLETPRLLLLSDKKRNAGLGNENDLVGRFFMEHLHWWSGYYVPPNPDMFSLTRLYNNIHMVNKVPIIGKLALSEEVLRHEKLLNYSVQFLPRVVLKSSLYPFFYPSTSSKGVASCKRLISAICRGDIPDNFTLHARNVISGIDNIAMAFYSKIRRKVVKNLNRKRVKVFQLAHMTEQVPNPNSRVILGEDCNSLGQRIIQLKWKLSSIDMLSAIRAQEIIDEELRRAGLGRLYIQMKGETPPRYLSGGWHHMGTTRMHLDPQKGVVDENCKVHGISNLFVAGPSVFPTGGYANPVLTIVALTVRLSDHVKRIMA